MDRADLFTDLAQRRHGDAVEIQRLPLVVCKRRRRLGLLVVDELDHGVEDLLLGEALHFVRFRVYWRVRWWVGGGKICSRSERL